MTAVNISALMRSPRLAGPFYAGPSWGMWQAILRATFGEPMTPSEVDAFRTVAERDPPKQRVRELIAIAGRGAGKDSVAALIAVAVAIAFKPHGKLRPGERAYVLALAVDRAQAAIVTSYVKGLFDAVPAFAAMVVGDTDGDAIDLANGVTIMVATNSFRTVRGRSLLAVIFDEACFWRSDESANPDEAVYGAVRPGLARVPGSMLIIISSVHKRAGLVYRKWRESYGKNDADVLVVLGSTTQFNPTFDQAIIDADMARDPQLFGAEYYSRWRDDLATFIPRDLIDAAVDISARARPPQSGIAYHAFCDPSGGVQDSFTAAIAHSDKNNVVLDLVYERKPPLNPSEVVAEVAVLLKSYRLHHVTGDRYAAQWTVEAFKKEGVTYRQSERDRSAIYLDALPLFTAGRARLINNPRMAAQFAALERRTFSNGKDRVDHGAGGHDDLANSAAGALVLAAGKSKSITGNITPEFLSALKRFTRPRGRIAYF